jgi:cytochrome c oxidase cbb3-type subunit III
VRGLRINEDTFTLQLRDADNRLYSFRKQDLKELKRDSSGSLMPSYKTVFSPTEIDDLIAYLASLRGER